MTTFPAGMPIPGLALQHAGSRMAFQQQGASGRARMRRSLLFQNGPNYYLSLRKEFFFNRSPIKEIVFAKHSGSVIVNASISGGALPEVGQPLAHLYLLTPHLGAISSSPAAVSSAIKANAAVDS